MASPFASIKRNATRRLGTSDSDIKHMESLGLEHFVGSTNVFYYGRHLKGSTPSKPILVLLHGYPQSSFMWRHVIPLLPTDVPLFIPDIPGYGRSSPLRIPHNKVNQGKAILLALQSVLKPSEAPISLIICGHDRGARICHRLAVDDNNSAFSILGSILLDIVPTLTQWESFSDPIASASSFHWSFLANPSIAVPMISIQGGDIFMSTCIKRWLGKAEKSVELFSANDAVQIYAQFARSGNVIQATCDDYRGGAEEDVEQQKSDQVEGRKIDSDVLVVYSESYLGKR